MEGLEEVAQDIVRRRSEKDDRIRELNERNQFLERKVLECSEIAKEFGKRLKECSSRSKELAALLETCDKTSAKQKQILDQEAVELARLREINQGLTETIESLYESMKTDAKAREAYFRGLKSRNDHLEELLYPILRKNASQLGPKQQQAIVQRPSAPKKYGEIMCQLCAKTPAVLQSKHDDKAVMICSQLCSDVYWNKQM